MKQKRIFSTTLAALFAANILFSEKLPAQTVLPQISAKMQSVLAFSDKIHHMETTDQPAFAELSYHADDRQFYHGDAPVGAEFQGFSVADGTLCYCENEIVLSPQDIGCEISTDENGDFTIISPFQTARLILKSGKEIRDDAAVSQVSGFRDLHILQYETPRAAYIAYQQYQQNSDVEYVTPDKIVSVCAADSSYQIPDSKKSWGVSAIGADQYCDWLESQNLTLPEITVAIIDTGISPNHKWFQGRISEGAMGFTSDECANWTDGNSHGTHVAGIIAQSTCQNVKLLPLKAVTDEGNGSLSDIYCAMMYAIEQHANIVNMSLGCVGDVPFLMDAAEEITKAGITLVTAAGNEGMDVQLSSPSMFEDAITISAVEKDSSSDEINYSPAIFSNHGAGLDFCAPGVGISSASTTGTESVRTSSGTSMAAPFASAVAADILSYRPNLSRIELYEEMKRSSVDLGDSGFDESFGYGLVNLSAQIPNETALSQSNNSVTAENKFVSDAIKNSADENNSESPSILENNQQTVQSNEDNTTDIDSLRLPLLSFGQSVHLKNTRYRLILEKDARISIENIENAENLKYSISDENGQYSVSDADISSKTELESGYYILFIESEINENMYISIQADDRSVVNADAKVTCDFYDGNSHKPQIHMSMDGTEMTQDVDFSLSYSGILTDCGKYRITIQGMGAYFGETSAFYWILPQPTADFVQSSNEIQTETIDQAGTVICKKWIPDADEYVLEKHDKFNTCVGICDENGEIVKQLDGSYICYDSCSVEVGKTYYIFAAWMSSEQTGTLTYRISKNAHLLESCTVNYNYLLPADCESDVPEFTLYDGKTKLIEGKDYIIADHCGKHSAGLVYTLLLGIGDYIGFFELGYFIQPDFNSLDFSCTHELSLNSPLYFPHNFPETVTIFHFRAETDGTYFLSLPNPFGTDEATPFIYDSANNLLPIGTNIVTLSAGDELTIVCAVSLAAGERCRYATYEVEVSNQPPENHIFSNGILYEIKNGEASIVCIMSDANGIQIPDYIHDDQNSTDVPVTDMHATVLNAYAVNHVFYVAEHGNAEKLCKDCDLLWAYADSQSTLCGDATGDGILNQLDAKLLALWIAEADGVTLNDAALAAADYDADGEATALDVIKIFAETNEL